MRPGFFDIWFYHWKYEYNLAPFFRFSIISLSPAPLPDPNLRGDLERPGVERYG